MPPSSSWVHLRVLITTIPAVYASHPKVDAVMSRLPLLTPTTRKVEPNAPALVRLRQQYLPQQHLLILLTSISEAYASYVQSKQPHDHVSHGTEIQDMSSESLIVSSCGYSCRSIAISLGSLVQEYIRSIRGDNSNLECLGAQYRRLVVSRRDYSSHRIALSPSRRHTAT